MVAQTQLAEGSLKVNTGGARGGMQGSTQGGMQGIGAESGDFVPNQDGGGQGHGRGNPVGQGIGMSIVALKQINLCHFCNMYGRWKQEC